MNIDALSLHTARARRLPFLRVVGLTHVHLHMFGLHHYNRGELAGGNSIDSVGFTSSRRTDSTCVIFCWHQLVPMYAFADRHLTVHIESCGTASPRFSHMALLVVLEHTEEPHQILYSAHSAYHMKYW